MSLRPRLPATSVHPAFAWSDTLEALADAHRQRRAADDTSRWPLAHACSHRRRAVGLHGGDVAGAAEARDPDESGPIQHAFCCRALG
jgi:hypothetical protein